jgi:hypothetical protein
MTLNIPKRGFLAQAGSGEIEFAEFAGMWAHFDQSVDH